MKLMVTGYGRHGKDTFCELSGLPFESSSHVCAEHVVFPVLAPKYGYKTLDECYADRINHRKEWFELIKAYNTPDLSRLSRKIFETSDIYCGIRNRDEFVVARAEGVFDLSIWVDASLRLPPESSASMTVSKEDCDIIITNNGTLEQFATKVRRLITALEH